MNKIGWKVVAKDVDELASAIALGKWARSYVVGERTTGFGDTPLLAFSTRRDARRFKGHTSYLRVFKASLENARLQECLAGGYRPGTFKGFWRTGHAVGYVPAPDSTLACDAITLLEPA